MRQAHLLNLAHTLILSTNRMEELRFPLEHILKKAKNFDTGLALLNHHFEELKEWDGGVTIHQVDDGLLGVTVPFNGGRGKFYVEVVDMGTELNLHAIHVTIANPVKGDAPLVWKTALKLNIEPSAMTTPTVAFEFNRNHLWTMFWNPVSYSIKLMAGEGIFTRDSCETLKFVQQAFNYL